MANEEVTPKEDESPELDDQVLEDVSGGSGGGVKEPDSNNNNNNN